MGRSQHILAIFILSIATFTMMSSASKAERQELAVIVHPSNPESGLSPGLLKKVMLGQKQRWSKDKQAISLALLKTSHPIGLQMVEEIFEMGVNEYKRYWPSQIFAMKCKAPFNFDSEQELVQFVARTPGAIGVVCACSERNGVKTLSLQTP